MNLSPGDKSVLTQFTTVAKKVIYDPGRMATFMKMLGTPQGAVQAVETVIGAIEQFKPIPPAVVPMLAVNCYMIMLDVAQAVTEAEIDPKMVEQVIVQILRNGAQPAPAQPTPAQPASAQPAPAQPGMLARMQQEGAPA